MRALASAPSGPSISRALGSRETRERSTVWIDLAGKTRPGVVIEAREDLVRVAYGTSQSRPVDGATVHPSTRAGRKFPLDTTTFFYGANTAWERPRALRLGASDCVRELFDEIRRIVEVHDAQANDEER